MSTLHLKIVTPEKEIYDGSVEGVNVSTTDGELGILPNHTALMARIKPGQLLIKQGGKHLVLAIGEGFMQVADNNLTVMTDLAVEEKDIDERAVEEAKKRAEKAMEEKLTNEEYAEALAVLEKSLAQLQVKRRHRVR